MDDEEDSSIAARTLFFSKWIKSGDAATLSRLYFALEKSGELSVAFDIGQHMNKSEFQNIAMCCFICLNLFVNNYNYAIIIISSN